MTPVEAAARIREALGFDTEARRDYGTWTEALRRFIEQAEQLGVMVMVSGVVLNNNRRHLDPQEFRGFALSDDRAPLVFINGADSKAAQMFTLAHELAHLWLGQTALCNISPTQASDNPIEVWCDEVAVALVEPIKASIEKAFRVRNPIVRSRAGGRVQSLAARAGRRFSRALIESTLEGRTLYRDAYRMLGIAKSGTFDEFGRSLGFPA